MLNWILVLPLLMVLIFNFGSLLLDGTLQILLTLPSQTLSVKLTLMEMEQIKIKFGLYLLHMDRLILLQMP